MIFFSPVFYSSSYACDALSVEFVVRKLCLNINAVSTWGGRVGNVQFDEF